MEPIQVIRGMRDILPDQTAWWQRMERELTQVLNLYGYCELRTPVLEPTSLFSRSIGEETDIVQKEMYTFQDRDGGSVTLRPECTASVVRSYIEQTTWKKEPVSRWYYLGPMFRHERPQKGRYRQFHQMGAELFGSPDPAADVELIDLMVECVRRVGLKETTLHTNTIGCKDCRPAYREHLVAFLKRQAGSLCGVCRRRIDTNPLRVLDCKEESCIRATAEAPRLIDHVCPACAEHFAQVRAGLDSLGIAFVLDHRMVRGLDYYTRTTFELLAEGLGAQNAVAAGGRYDGLVSALGGPETPAVGFAAGLERILLCLMQDRSPPVQQPVAFFVTRSEACWRASLPLMQRLRRSGFKVHSDVRRGSLKSQMKRADKDNARVVLVVGEDELKDGTVTVKDMLATSEAADKQILIPQEQLEEQVERFLNPVQQQRNDS